MVVRGTGDYILKPDTDDDDYRLLSNSGRWQEHAIPTGERGYHIMAANYYGSPGAIRQGCWQQPFDEHGGSATDCTSQAET